MGEGAHPLQALAWALLGRAWLFWVSDLCLCSLKRALTPPNFRHTGGTRLLLRRQVLHWKGCQKLGAYLCLLAKGTQSPPGLLGQVDGGMTRGPAVLTRGRTCPGG